jgi:hypothetical protein
MMISSWARGDRMFVALRASCLVLAYFALDKAGDVAAASTNGGDVKTALSSIRLLSQRTGKPEPGAPQAEPLSETDHRVLEDAAAACKDRDGQAFSDAFIQSAAVRRKYSAPMITLALETQDNKRLRQANIAKSEYKDFPIMTVDYYRKPARPLRAVDDDEYVEVSVYQSHRKQLAIGWIRVRYDGKSEGGEGLGNAFTLDGKPYDPAGPLDGQLLFRLTSECWELVSDIRYDIRGTPWVDDPPARGDAERQRKHSKRPDARPIAP